MLGRRKKASSPYPGFVKTGEVRKDVIDGFAARVPADVVDAWAAGTGWFADGLLRAVDPYLTSVLISSSYTGIATAVPVLQTAFGDVIVWEVEQKMFRLLSFRREVNEMLTSLFSTLVQIASSDAFLDGDLDGQLYRQAVDKFGPLEADAIFGHVPLLALGGPKDVDHLDKVKTREHLLLISQMVGPLS